MSTYFSDSVTGVDMPEEKVSPEGLLSFGALRVAHVNTRDRKIVVACDLEESDAVLAGKLETEDAKRLAIRQAKRSGFAEPMIKNASIGYGSVDGKDNPLPKPGEKAPKFVPYLVVEIHSVGGLDTEFVGDSLL
jgi:hypothetical protein